MSWDIFVQDLPHVPSVNDIPEDFQPGSLGSRDAVIAKIVRAIPSADFGDPSWGLADGEGWSIEFNMGDGPECDAFALHVRGGGDGAIEAVAAVLSSVGARALDAQTGKFFDPAAARASFRDWQAYRDQVVAEPRSADPPKRSFLSRLFGG